MREKIINLYARGGWNITARKCNKKIKYPDGSQSTKEYDIFTLYAQNSENSLWAPIELDFQKEEAIELRDFLLYCYPKE